METDLISASSDQRQESGYRKLFVVACLGGSLSVRGYAMTRACYSAQAAFLHFNTALKTWKESQAAWPRDYILERACEVAKPQEEM